jgi:hypothetical protein
MKSLKTCLAAIAVLLSSTVALAGTIPIDLSNIQLSYVGGGPPETVSAPVAGTVGIDGTVAAGGTASNRLFGITVPVQGGFVDGDSYTFTLKASSFTTLDGLAPLARFVIAGPGGNNLFVSNRDNIDLIKGTAPGEGGGTGYETFTMTLEPYNFNAWPANSTGASFNSTIADASMIGLEFLTTAATGTQADYNNLGQLPSYGAIGQLSISQVSMNQATVTPEPSSFVLLAVALVIGLGVWATRKKICDL